MSIKGFFERCISTPVAAVVGAVVGGAKAFVYAWGAALQSASQDMGMGLGLAFVGTVTGILPAACLAYGALRGAYLGARYGFEGVTKAPEAIIREGFRDEEVFGNKDKNPYQKVKKTQEQNIPPVVNSSPRSTQNPVVQQPVVASPQVAQMRSVSQGLEQQKKGVSNSTQPSRQFTAAQNLDRVDRQLASRNAVVTEQRIAGPDVESFKQKVLPKYSGCQAFATRAGNLGIVGPANRACQAAKELTKTHPTGFKISGTDPQKIAEYVAHAKKNNINITTITLKTGGKEVVYQGIAEYERARAQEQQSRPAPVGKGKKIR